jgi:hypothetical protein
MMEEKSFGAQSINRPRAVVACSSEGLARVCSWCTGQEQAATWCMTQNLKMTHTICPDCQSRFMGEIGLG